MAVRVTAAPSIQRVPWWSEVQPEQWRTLLASWAGWVLDAFDFTLVLLVLGDIARTFSVGLVAMGVVLTGTLIGRVIGGVLSGMWADRVGRRTPLMVSILAYSLFELLSGFAPTYSVFLIFRLLFGIGMGGEWAAGTPLAMESWPKRSRGIASGFLQGGWPVGYLLATIVYGIVFPVWGWRAPFFIGAAPALLVLFIRSRVKESPIWLERHRQLQRDGRRSELSLFSLFHRDIIATTLHATAVMGGLLFSYAAISAFWPTFLSRTLHLSVSDKTVFLILLNLGSVAGNWTAGWISERAGRRPTLVIFALLSACFIPLYVLTTDRTLVMIGGILMGAIGTGMWGIVPAYLTERFPTSVRGVGPGTTYHIGTALGSFTPTLQALLVSNGLTLAHSMAVTILAAALILAALVFFGPEPRGREFAPTA